MTVTISTKLNMPSKIKIKPELNNKLFKSLIARGFFLNIYVYNLSYKCFICNMFVCNLKTPFDLKYPKRTHTLYFI